jgi:hypothetical protein
MYIICGILNLGMFSANAISEVDLWTMQYAQLQSCYSKRTGRMYGGQYIALFGTSLMVCSKYGL